MPAWSISAAGTCLSTTARKSTNTAPCAPTPACSTSRTCASSISPASACAPSSNTRWPTTSPNCKRPGRALYSCLLNPDGGVIDDLIVYYFGEDHFRVVVNAGTADKDIAWFGQLNAEGGFGLTITPRRDYAIVAVQGPNAREKVWQTVPAARAATEAVEALQRRAHRQHAVRRTDRRPHRLHRRRRLRNHRAGGSRRSAVERAASPRRAPGRSRRARHAAPRSRHEPVRPGHGRQRLAARRRPRLDGRPRPRRATSSAKASWKRTVRRPRSSA